MYLLGSTIHITAVMGTSSDSHNSTWSLKDIRTQAVIYEVTLLWPHRSVLSSQRWPSHNNNDPLINCNHSAHHLLTLSTRKSNVFHQNHRMGRGQKIPAHAFWMNNFLELNSGIAPWVERLAQDQKILSSSYAECPPWVWTAHIVPSSYCSSKPQA